jgi:DUF1680 family protein
MKTTQILLSLFFAIFLVSFQGCKNSSTFIENKWQSFQTLNEEGLLGERIDLWRHNRLWYMANSGYLLKGFENRTESTGWHGEHIGKWLHAATLAYQVNKDEKLKQELDKMVDRLIATQLPNGYLGTTTEKENFVAVPDVNGWDVWIHRYNLYGLLTYDKYFPNEEVIETCKKMGDLLIDVYGEGKADITRHGNRQGISAMTILESIVMLYQKTGEKKYLDFAEHIVYMDGENSRLKLVENMLDNVSVVYSGDGKAYQLMANLLGYLQLYRCTQNEDYLNTALHGWEDIHTHHLTVAGGPWGRGRKYNGHGECFAHSDGFDPAEALVEGCSGTTWIQLNLHLFEFTGNARYLDEVELTIFNDLIGHQCSDGIQWSYMSIPNDSRLKPYEHSIKYHCCASSMPRGLEMFSNHLAGTIKNSLSFGSLSPATIEMPENFGGGTVEVKGNFPLASSVEIHFQSQKSKSFPVEFRLPVNTLLSEVRINGKKTTAQKNDRGFYELSGKWENGDVVNIDMEYQLKAKIQPGENDSRWVAFNYGPMALAEKIMEEPKEKPEPFLEIDAKSTPSELAAMLVNSSDNLFSVNGTEITLMPYYQTCTMESRPRTYFELP